MTGRGLGLMETANRCNAKGDESPRGTAETDDSQNDVTEHISDEMLATIVAAWPRLRLTMCATIRSCTCAIRTALRIRRQ